MSRKSTQKQVIVAGGPFRDENNIPYSYGDRHTRRKLNKEINKMAAKIRQAKKKAE